MKTVNVTPFFMSSLPFFFPNPSPRLWLPRLAGTLEALYGDASELSRSLAEIAGRGTACVPLHEHETILRVAVFNAHQYGNGFGDGAFFMHFAYH